ncbi:MAG TPA: hypothetical protein VK730_13600 [Solirubrobacteraceae bacterium]|jgi:hypothetical protein|nr:hypothetical protein [Solirubrobacteraceae bacterium]
MSPHASIDQVTASEVEESAAIAKANALVAATTCTVTTTANSAVVAGTSTNWTNALVGQWMHIPGAAKEEEDLLAEIVSVKSTTELTLAAEAKTVTTTVTATIGPDQSLALIEGCELAKNSKQRFYVRGLMLMVAKAVNTFGVLEAHPEASTIGFAVSGLRYAREGGILKYRVRSKTSGSRVGTQPFMSSHLSINDLTSLSNSTSGEDAYGKYFLTNVEATQCVTNKVTPITAGVVYDCTLLLGGTLPQEIFVEFYNASNAFVSNHQVLPFGGSYSAESLANSPVSGEPVEIPLQFTVPAEVTQFAITIKGYTGRALKLYEINFAADSVVPRKRVRDIPIPYRGFSFQQFNQLSWMFASVMTPGRAYKRLSFIDSTFHPDGLRIFFGIDAACFFSAASAEEERKGKPTGFIPAALERAEQVLALTQAMGLTVVPVLICPVRGGSGDEQIVTNREILTSAEVRAAYIERLKEFVARFEHYPHIAGWDVVNEASYELAANRSGTKTFTQQQIAETLTELYTALRTVTAKPLILSCPDGGSARHLRYLLSQDLYDIVDHHSYGDTATWDILTMQHPLISLEVGPAPGETEDQKFVQGVAPILTSGAAVVSAAWMWLEGWLTETGKDAALTANKHYISLAKRY